jgi:hypothetical protein
MGLEGGYLRLGGREAQKQGWQEFLFIRLSGVNYDSPPAKMSQAQSKFWVSIHLLVTVAIATASL